MKPIVSTIGSQSYKLAKELARILTPLAGNTMQAVKKSTSFVDKIHEIGVEPQDRIISFDVANWCCCMSAHTELVADVVCIRTRVVLSFLL